MMTTHEPTEGNDSGMKTCTLIVRLIGLALVCNGTVALIEALRLPSAASEMMLKFNIAGQIPVVVPARYYVYFALQIVCGAAAVWRAGLFASLLTRDAPKETPPPPQPDKKPGSKLMDMNLKL